MSDIVRAIDLTEHFRNVAVLNGLNLAVPQGSVFGLAGPNGSGKTTTIKILMNILKPTSGSAELLGIDSRKLGPESFANIGYVSENQELPEWMTVEYLLAYLKPFGSGAKTGWREMMKRCNGSSRSRICSKDGTSTDRSSFGA